MNQTLHVGHIPDALDDIVVHVPGRVHPTELSAWLALLFVTRASVSDETRPNEIACNSPALADCFDPEDVVVWSATGRNARLSTFLARPRHAGWVGLFKSGELWTMIGEDWIDE